MEWDAETAPGEGDIARMAEAAIDGLPEPYRAAARDVTLRVEDFAPEAILSEMGFADAFELTGLYDGIPLTEKSVSDQPVMPDQIWLFRRPILDEWCARGDVTLADLVAHVFVHELAHHFGWSDEEIARIDKWWE